MRKESGRVALVLIVVLLFVFLVLGGAIWGVRKMLGGNVPKVGAKTVLHLDFGQPIAENVGTDAFSAALFGETLKLRDLVLAMERAATDDRVVALLARVDGTLGMAAVQEVRDAIAVFAESGKATIAYNDTFGEWGPANGAYYLATAFDEVYVQPSGDLGLTGLRYETMFLRGVFDKLGAEPILDHRYEFKNAKNVYTETEFTESHEFALRAVMDSQFDQLLSGVAEGREMSDEDVRTLVDRGPYYGQEVLAAGLVDDLLYRDQIYDRIYDEFGEDVEFTEVVDYAASDRKGFDSGEGVALVYGIGAVTRGESDFDPLSGSQSMGSETVAQAIRDAVEDESVSAILFRVDSPGGSYVASDTILRETILAQEAGIPVIVSMGNVAASGGYFVAAFADRIIAQPGTITGSIGVLGGKLVTRSTWGKVGVTWDAVQTSDNSAMWTGMENYDELGYERFQRGLDRIYEDFTEKVAAGRGLPLDRVQEIAKGRIWSGEDALEVGLVDELGGYPVALAAVREELGLDADARLDLRVFPQPKSPLEAWLDRGFSTGIGAEAGLVQSLIERLQPLVEVVDRLGTAAEPQTLSMPDPGLVEASR